MEHEELNVHCGYTEDHYPRNIGNLRMIHVAGDKPWKTLISASARGLCADSMICVDSSTTEYRGREGSLLSDQGRHLAGLPFEPAMKDSTC